MHRGNRFDEEGGPEAGTVPTGGPTGGPAGETRGKTGPGAVSPATDSEAQRFPISRPRYLGGGAQPVTPRAAGHHHGAAGSVDLSAIEAILRSPIDSQGPGPQRDPHPAPPHSEEESTLEAGLRSQLAGLGTPRTALLGQVTRHDRGPAAAADGVHDGNSAERSNGDGRTLDTAGEISRRAFQRFKRPSTFSPRTAFLQSPALGERPPRHGAARDDPRGAVAQHVHSAGSVPLSGSAGAMDDGLTDDFGASGRLEHDPNEPLLTKEEIDAFFSMVPPDSEETAVADSPTESPVDQTRPAWLKSQVADLADLVQALDLQARAHHAHVGLEDELTRLRQFTRTVGFVASPPPRGDQEFDMATLTEEALGALAGKTPNAPRILFRKRGDRTETIADKSLVMAALDAVLHTAISSAGSGDVVRVTVEGRSGEPVVTDVEFPAGPLAERHPDEILMPYGLRKILPEIGPNALAAAGAIAVGQGGDLTLARDEEGKLTFSLELPGSETA